MQTKVVRKHHAVRQSAGSHIFDIIIHIVLVIVSLLCLLPFLHVAAMSLSSNGAVISQRVFFWPVEFSVEGYKMVVQDPSMMRSLGITVLVTVGFTALGMLFSILAAYPLTKKDLKGRGVFAFMYMFTMYFGGGLIPEYLLMNDLHLLENRVEVRLRGVGAPLVPDGAADVHESRRVDHGVVERRRRLAVEKRALRVGCRHRPYADLLRIDAELHAVLPVRRGERHRGAAGNCEADVGSDTA